MSSPTLIIIDDSKFQISIHKRFFQTSLDYKVLATGFNGLQAIELYKQHKPDFITLDISMPELSGFEAAKEILKFDPQAKIIIISSQQGEIESECLAIGCKLYFKKPLPQTPAFIQNLQTTLANLK